MSRVEPLPPPAVFLPWDTEFFGFRIGRVTANRLTPDILRAVLSWSEVEQLRCLYLSADPDCSTTLTLAHEGRFKFVDIRLDLAIDLERSPPLPASACFRAISAEELPALETMSRMAHTDTRFFKDMGFPQARAAELYVEWIRRDYRVHRIFTVESTHPTTLAGYVTCQIDVSSRAGRIGLIAVAENERGCGYGRALVQGALHWFRESGCREVKVATQASNVAAQRLYQSAGFKTAAVSATYHRWF